MVPECRATGNSQRLKKQFVLFIALSGMHYCLQLLTIVFCSVDLFLSPSRLKRWSSLEFMWGPVIYLQCYRLGCNINWKMQQVR